MDCGCKSLVSRSPEPLQLHRKRWACRWDWIGLRHLCGATSVRKGGVLRAIEAAYSEQERRCTQSKRGGLRACRWPQTQRLASSL